MKIVWDSYKAKVNRLKHQIYFSDVEPVFYDPLTISCMEENTEGEERFIATGGDALGRVLTIIYTHCT